MVVLSSASSSGPHHAHNHSHGYSHGPASTPGMAPFHHQSYHQQQQQPHSQAQPQHQHGYQSTNPTGPLAVSTPASASYYSLYDPHTYVAASPTGQHHTTHPQSPPQHAHSHGHGHSHGHVTQQHPSQHPLSSPLASASATDQSFVSMATLSPAAADATRRMSLYDSGSTLGLSQVAANTSTPTTASAAPDGSSPSAGGAGNPAGTPTSPARRKTRTNRSVSGMTREQVERKRANDREAQRRIRQRIKEQMETNAKEIEGLRRELSRMTDSYHLLEEENGRLRAALDQSQAAGNVGAADFSLQRLSIVSPTSGPAPPQQTQAGHHLTGYPSSHGPVSFEIPVPGTLASPPQSDVHQPTSPPPPPLGLGISAVATGPLSPTSTVSYDGTTGSYRRGNVQPYLNSASGAVNGPENTVYSYRGNMPPTGQQCNGSIYAKPEREM